MCVWPGGSRLVNFLYFLWLLITLGSITTSRIQEWVCLCDPWVPKKWEVYIYLYIYVWLFVIKMLFILRFEDSFLSSEMSKPAKPIELNAFKGVGESDVSRMCFQRSEQQQQQYQADEKPWYHASRLTPLSFYTHTHTQSRTYTHKHSRMISREHHSLLLQSWQSSDKSSPFMSLCVFFYD